MYGRMVELGLVDSTWHRASAHCFVSAAFLLGGFASFEETNLQNMGTMVEPGLVDLPWQCASVYFFFSAAIFAPRFIPVVPHTPYSTG